MVARMHGCVAVSFANRPFHIDLTGMVHGLFLTCQAMAKTHPNIDLVATALERADLQGLAFLEKKPDNSCA